jgi:hypothetical protein
MTDLNSKLVYCPKAVLDYENPKFSLVSEVYCPRAVFYRGTEHANEGGGGQAISVMEAAQLGATNFRDPDCYGVLMADWPQSYWRDLNE